MLVTALLIMEKVTRYFRKVCSLHHNLGLNFTPRLHRVIIADDLSIVTELII